MVRFLFSILFFTFNRFQPPVALYPTFKKVLCLFSASFSDEAYVLDTWKLSARERASFPRYSERDYSILNFPTSRVFSQINEIVCGEKSRQALIHGVNQPANAVKITPGPRGRNVVPDRKYGSRLITRDGVTVAKEIELKDGICFF